MNFKIHLKSGYNLDLDLLTLSYCSHVPCPRRSDPGSKKSNHLRPVHLKHAQENQPTINLSTYEYRAVSLLGLKIKKVLMNWCINDLLTDLLFYQRKLEVFEEVVRWRILSNSIKEGWVSVHSRKLDNRVVKFLIDKFWKEMKLLSGV